MLTLSGCTLSGCRRIALGVALTSTALITQAGQAQDARDALENCIRAFKHEIGAGNYFALDRNYYQLVGGMGEYRYFLNATDRNPSVDAQEEFRADCISGGFARFRQIDVSQGRWTPELIERERGNTVVSTTD